MWIGNQILQIVINDWLVRMMDRINDIMLDFIWESGWNSRGDTLWDAIIPLAMVLGTIFSLVLIGKIAYKTMALEEGLDFMKLWKPIAMSFIIANWYVVTSSIFSLTQPFEDYFREGFMAKNEEIIKLQRKRIQATMKMEEINREKTTEAEIGEQFEDLAWSTEEDGIPDNEDDEEENAGEILRSTYGEVYLDLEDAPLDADGNPLPKYDATTETKIVGAQNFLERVMMWIAEVIWAAAVLVLFLVRAFFMCVLVMFGPIYMAASILPAWEDAWKEWLERYIWVCFLGAAAYLGLVFSSYILIWGLENDVANWQDFTQSEVAWYEWFAYMLKTFACSIGVYLTALLVGMGVIGTTFELATYFYPSKAIRGAADMFNGIWNTAEYRTRQAAREVEKETRKAGQKAAGAAQAHFIHKNEQKAKESLDIGTEMGPEGKMRAGQRTGEFRQRPNSYDDHRNSTQQQTASTGTFAAHRWADRLWQDKVDKSRQTNFARNAERMSAIQQDLDEFLKAQQDGRASEFMQEHAERMLENRILLSIATGKTVGLHYFGGDKTARDNFLRKHGLYDAFMRAEKLEEKAAKQGPTGNYRKHRTKAARELTAERIRDLMAEKTREILAARGIVFNAHESGADNPSPTTGNTGQTTGQQTAQTGNAYSRTYDDHSQEGTYRVKQGDEGYDNVQEQMQDSWFRKLSANKRNRALLMQTLMAYEQALNDGRGEEFIQDMKHFSEFQRAGFDDDENVVHPFAGVSMSEREYGGMWDQLRDTEKLRKINEALDAIEKANEKNNGNNNA